MNIFNMSLMGCHVGDIKNSKKQRNKALLRRLNQYIRSAVFHEQSNHSRIYIYNLCLGWSLRNAKKTSELSERALL